MKWNESTQKYDHFCKRHSPPYTTIEWSELDKLRTELSDLQATFDLRHKADMRAIALWREGHPERDLTLPDHADLCGWLLERVKFLEGQVKTFRFALGDLVTEAENLADTDGCLCEGECCQVCLTLHAVKRGYEILDHKNVDRDIYGDDLADARAESDQYQHDRDAVAGELAVVRERVSELLAIVTRAWYISKDGPVTAILCEAFAASPTTQEE